MSNYWDSKFLKHVHSDNIKIIFEVGARYGDESIKLSNIFPNSKIHSFECNPLTIEICKEKLSNIKSIKFNDFGLGNREENLPFYSYTKNNDGASSLFKRIDFHSTQIESGIIKIKTLKEYVYNNDIPNIDLLCMDVQGYELNILKGAEDFIRKINYIIMEQPKVGMKSKYINAPLSQEIKEFMIKNNFIEIERIRENDIEDNVMYKNKLNV